MSAKTDSASLISLIEVSENEAEHGNESEREERNREVGVKLKGVSRAIRNWRKCFACNEKKNLHRPSKEMRIYFCKSKKIYVQKNDRVCTYHAQSENWDQVRCKTASNFSSKVVDEMISLLLNQEIKNTVSHIDNGLTDIQFNQIINELGLSPNSTKKEKQMILAVRLYIERLRHGHTFEHMGHLHNMDRRTIGAKVKIGRNLLLNNFVPNHLGHENLTRQWLVDHTTKLAHLLYCDNDLTKCVVVADGTYIYTCSTSNHTHQRKIYSGQKKRHLFKIMKLIAVDGAIIDVFGPFPATFNDSKILNEIFERNSFRHILHAGDIILVDRGFRDSIKILEKQNLIVKIPEFIQKGTDKQLTCKQGNKSRLVTKMRFAIETANGRMKSKWNLFAKIIPSILTPHLMPDYKVGAAILNAFAKPIICDKIDFQTIGTRMMDLVNKKNELSRIIKSKRFQRIQKHCFGTIEEKDLTFPRFNKEQLKNFSLGTYAIRQAISYAAEHKKVHGQFKISILPNDHLQALFKKVCLKKKIDRPIFISVNMKSRYRGKKKHMIYILYDSNGDIGKILHYCTCQHGQRTIGCCAHIMTVVWYFSFGRYGNAKDPASHLNDFFITQ